MRTARLVGRWGYVRFKFNPRKHPEANRLEARTAGTLFRQCTWYGGGFDSRSHFFGPFVSARPLKFSSDINFGARTSQSVSPPSA